MLLEMLNHPVIFMGLVFVVVCLVVGFILSNKGCKNLKNSKADLKSPDKPGEAERKRGK